MAFTALNIILTIFIAILVLFGLIFAYKKYLAHQSNQLIVKYKDQNTSPIIKKYPEANVFKLQSTFLGMGFLFSTGFALLIINWTYYDKNIEEELLCLCSPDIIEQEIPRTSFELPVPPPPPPVPEIEEITDEFIEETIEFSSIDNYDEPLLDTEPPSIKASDIHVSSFETEEIDEELEEIFTVVEDMPCFPGCEDLPTNDERKKCTETNLLKFMYKHVKYPSISRESGIEGLVVVTFIIDKNSGQVKNTRWLKDIGGGCADSAVHVVNLMNDKLGTWRPGIQNGEYVHVRYNMPVRIRLQQN